MGNLPGAAQSARFFPCLPLYPFSPAPHLNNRPLSVLPSSTRHYTSPSPPSIPIPVLWTPRHLSALMPASIPPPSCGHLVFKLKFTEQCNFHLNLAILLSICIRVHTRTHSPTSTNLTPGLGITTRNCLFHTLYIYINSRSVVVNTSTLTNIIPNNTFPPNTPQTR